MAIDKVIYNNGIKGLLSHYEIDSLPSDYEMHKGNFHEMTEKKLRGYADSNTRAGESEEIEDLSEAIFEDDF